MKREPRRHDLWLLGAILALAGFGLVLVYSSSAVFAAQRHHDATYFLKRHVVYLTLGVGALMLGAYVDFGVWRRLSAPLLAGSLALLACTAVPGLAARVGGAARWIRVGPLTIQPSELAKFALVVYLAAFLARRLEQAAHGDRPPLGLQSAIGFAGPAVVVLVLVGLVLRQPDLGTAALMLAVALLVLFAAGIRKGYLLAGLLVAAPVGWLLIVKTPWRLRRLLAFVDPWAHRWDVGYQVSESLISVGSGGIWGLGLGDGKQKLFFLPEAHTDFILAIIGEELGFVGIALIVIAFGMVLWRGVRAALRARDAFGAYLALGITSTMVLGALIHTGVTLGLLPTKGITLPLVSYGGSALVMTLLGAGVLLNIATGAPEPPRLRLERSTEGNRRVAAEKGAR
jgi:cell division protein FtsW